MTTKDRLETDEFIRYGIEICADRKAENILVFDLRNVSVLTDYCLICTGNSVAHIRAIQRHLEKDLKSIGIVPRTIEGSFESCWVLVDCNELIIHIFDAQTRTYYDIESLFDPENRIYPEMNGG